MSYCPNPRCSDRANPTTATHCSHCNTPLLLQGRYRLVRPLRTIDEWEPIDVFEVDDNGESKVLKLLKNEHLQATFEREANTLKQLKHEGIPKVESDGYFSCDIGGRKVFYLIMEKIEGSNLDEWLQAHEPIDQTTAVRWLSQLLDILSQLHQKELFHRDIKLSNIMLRSNGHLALVDFGAVRPMTNTYFAKVGSGGLREVTSVVSPGYTPVEQVSGRAVPQSDFYSLGRSFVHLLTGKHPIDLPEDESTGLLTWRDQLGQPIEDWLMDLLDSMMAPFPGQRPANVNVLQQRLNQSQKERENQQKQQSRKVNSLAGRLNASLVKVDWLVVANIWLLLLQLWLGWRWLSIRQYRNTQYQKTTSTSLVSQPITPSPLFKSQPM